MATVIDALMVTLGLDPAEFKKGTAQAKKAQQDLTNETKKSSKERERIDRTEQREKTKHFKQSEQQFRKSADSIRHVRNQALATLAVFTGGMGMLMFAKNTMFGAAAMGRMSDNIGMSVKNIAGWQLAIERMGGSAADANGLLSNVASSIGQFRSSGTLDQMLQTYTRYGGQLPNGRNTTEGQALTGISGLLSRMYAMNPLMARSIAQQMGMNSSQFNLLKQGPMQVQRLVNQLGAASGMNGRFSKEAQRVQAEMVLLNAKFRRVGITILNDLQPQIQKLVQWLDRLGTWADSHGPQINQWINNFTSASNRIAQSLGGWQRLFEILLALKAVQIAAKLAMIARPLVGLAASLGTIAASAGALSVLSGVGALVMPNNSIASQKQENAAMRNPSARSRAFQAMAARNFAHLQALGGPTTNHSSVTTSSAETHIGKIDIITQAVDAAGIGAEIGPMFNQWATQMNSGMQ